VIGRAEFRYWPPGDIGTVGHGDGDEADSSQFSGVFASP
jgi:hypothetical protein